MDEQPALEELTRRLTDERRTVTYLLMKLSVTKLLRATDDRQFVSDALEEVDRTVELLHEGEQQRGEALRDLASSWQVSDELTLETCSLRAPSPYDQTLREHLIAFRELAADIEAAASEDGFLGCSRIDQLSDAIHQLTGVQQPKPATDESPGRLHASPAGDEAQASDPASMAASP